MGALDTRLSTSHHTPTDSVSQLEPDCVQLACTGCWWPSVARLSLPRYSTHNPHPCTILTAAHNTHTRPPDAPACLAYQRQLMNSYCIFDLCADLVFAKAIQVAAHPGHTQRGRRRPPWCRTPRHVRPGRHFDRSSGPWWLQFSRSSPSSRR